MLIVTLTQSFDKCLIYFHLRKYFTWCNCWEKNDLWCQWSYIATLTAHTSVMVPMFTLLHDLNWLKFSSSSFGFHLLKRRSFSPTMFELNWIHLIICKNKAKYSLYCWFDINLLWYCYTQFFNKDYIIVEKTVL